MAIIQVTFVRQSWRAPCWSGGCQGASGQLCVYCHDNTREGASSFAATCLPPSILPYKINVFAYKDHMQSLRHMSYFILTMCFLGWQFYQVFRWDFNCFQQSSKMSCICWRERPGGAHSPVSCLHVCQIAWITFLQIYFFLHKLKVIILIITS